MLTDFSLKTTNGKDFRILQLTDMQVIDAAQKRYPERLNKWADSAWATDKVEECCYSEIRKTVAKAKPDYIFITGDVIYGSFDDAGTSLDAFIDFMDSLGIPWSIVYGNHDNESRIGVIEQSRRFANGRNSLFKTGNVSGHSNYTVGIYEGDRLVRVFYMLDSNWCCGSDDPIIKNTIGFQPDQIEWYRNTAREISEKCGRKIPSSFCCHIPTKDVLDAEYEAGYRKFADKGKNPSISIGYSMPNAKYTVPAVTEGDWGCDCQDCTYGGLTCRMEDDFLSLGTDSEFAGHVHNMNYCIHKNGIKYVLGIKCGTYDFHLKGQLGGTLINIPADCREKIEVSPVYNEIDI